MLYGVKNPHGGDRYGDGIALDFSANVSPLGTPKCVTEAIERGLPELYRYPDSLLPGTCAGDCAL